MCTLITGISNLDKHIRAIDKLDESAKKNIFEIAVRLNIIDTEGLAKDAGYKNTAALAADAFGFARSTTLNYIRVARNYLIVKSDDNAKKMQIATICEETDEDGKSVDYKIGQLNAITVDAETFAELDESGVINKSMSADTIRKAIKDYLKEDDSDDSDGDGDGDGENEGGESNPATFIDYLNQMRAIMDKMKVNLDGTLNSNTFLDSVTENLTKTFDNLETVYNERFGGENNG